MYRFALAALVTSLVGSTATASELGNRGMLYLELSGGFTSFSGESTATMDTFFGTEEITADLPDRTRVIINGTFGAFVADGFFIGGTLSLDSDSQELRIEEDDITLTSSSTTFGFAVAPRFYLSLNQDRSVFFKVGAHLGYYAASADQKEDGELLVDDTLSGFGLGAELGFVITLGVEAGAAIDISLFAAKRWLSGEREDEDNDPFELELDTTTIGLSVGLGAFF